LDVTAIVDRSCHLRLIFWRDNEDTDAPVKKFQAFQKKIASAQKAPKAFAFGAGRLLTETCRCGGTV
jgi:hypothetical protein